MEVVDPKGARLGEIKDIVFDLKSQRVAYAVLGTATAPQKLVAVPLNALKAAADSEHLVLSTDRAKLEAAKGLTDNNWPAAVNPVWAAQASGSESTPRVSMPRR
jgi:sporulation protein YlmC with PRC-barrel domain